MKNSIRLFAIGLMTMLLSFETSLLFSQSKGKTIKKGSIYICNMEKPKQVAVYGTPAWVLNTLFFLFEDGQNGGMGGQACVYAIDTYTGGIGNAIANNTTESVPFLYKVRNGHVYIWESKAQEPKDESGYLLILTIEDNDYLLPIKTSQQNMLNLSKFVYMGNYKEIKSMSDMAADMVEKNALTKLLSVRNQETNIELVESSEANSELVESSEASTDSIYNGKVDEMPTYPGGEMAMCEYIGRNIKYPQRARENGIQGRVFVGLVIEKDGSISNVKVLKGIGDECDEEAVRVVKSMPRWKPGKNNGKLVRVSFCIPISFRLGSE